jgi:hypothetical protein
MIVPVKLITSDHFVGDKKLAMFETGHGSFENPKAQKKQI